MTDNLYRPCVGIVLQNEEGKVFVGERIDTPGAWQMPQGGIDTGEDIERAAFRELKEEVGTDKAEFVKILPETVRYETPLDIRDRLQKIWGAPYIGQEQSWVVMNYLGSDEDIQLDAYSEPEFLQWQWIDIKNTLDLIVPFKRDVYRKIIEQLNA